MTKITFKNLPDTSTPLSAENLNLLQQNVEDGISASETGLQTQITNMKTYSTTETPCGIWIDDKIIYRKVLTGTCDNTSEQIIESNIDYIDNVVSITGNFVRISDGLTSPIGSYLDGVPSRVMYHGGLGKILLNKESSVWNSGFYYKIIIEYTKPTE